MQDSFHRNLIEEQDRIILFIGGGGKSTLIRRLNDDCTALHKKTIFLSFFLQKFPVESKTIIASDTKTIVHATSREFKRHQSLYIGKKYENNALKPFSNSEIVNISKKINGEHIFLEADHCEGKSLSTLKKVPAISTLNADRCIFVIGADVLNQTYSKIWTNSSDNYWRQNKTFSPLNICAWYSENITLNRLLRRRIPVTCFINKVENTYTGNLALVLAKELKKIGFDKVLTGSVFESSLQVIK